MHACTHARTQDVLDVLDLDARRDPSAKLELKIGGFDLIWDGGPVMRYDKPTSLPSMLGKCRRARACVCVK